MSAHLSLVAGNGRDRNDTVRRVCIHHEVDQVVDAAYELERPMLRALAQHVGESRNEDPMTERAILLTLAGYCQALVEDIDRRGAQ
jgi:hypothetical protein